MAEICCGIVSDNEATTSPPSAYERSSSRVARRRRMEIRRIKVVASVSSSGNQTAEEEDGAQKRRKLEITAAVSSRSCDSELERCSVGNSTPGKNGSPPLEVKPNGVGVSCESIGRVAFRDSRACPKYGAALACGKRRDMEDAVAIRPLFDSHRGGETKSRLHYFGVYDGHGCSHVAMRCKERLHELVREEVEAKREWKSAMGRSFRRMDEEVVAWNESVMGAKCRCELQTPECNAVGSTAVVAIVTPDKIVVANCGDSRAVLCRNGKPIPLSFDHKPDRPDELERIEAAGGRIIFWDAPRVLGVLAMSRAIGDNYLKPYVSCEPEVTVTERVAEDECLILASDGLWDVVSNEMACGVARMCLRGGRAGDRSGLLPSLPRRGEDGDAGAWVGGSRGVEGGEGIATDKACADASMLLMKLALARNSADNVSVVVVDLRKDT